MQRFQRLSTFQSIVILLHIVNYERYLPESVFSLRLRKKKASYNRKVESFGFDNTSGSRQSTDELFSVE